MLLRLKVFRHHLVIALCFTLLVGTNAEVFHQLLVDHVYCFEHAAREHSAHAAVTRGGGDNTAAATIAQAEPGHDHDQACTFQATLLRLNGPAPVDLKPLIVSVLSPTTRLIFSDGARAPPIAYAPKTSPPPDRVSQA